MRYFLRAFFILLAFFFLFISVLSAVLLAGPFSTSSNLSASKRRAMERFWDRDRVAWDLTTTPVGRCFSWTADDVLFLTRGKHQLAKRVSGFIEAYNLLPTRTASLKKALFDIIF